jgi:hypothetical protein
MSGRVKFRLGIISAIALSLVVYIIAMGQGCSKSAPSSPVASSSSSTAVTSTSGGSVLGIEPLQPDPTAIVPMEKTVGVGYAQQVLDQYSSCLGVRPSDRTVATYEAKKGAISTFGTHDTVTPPMLMALTNIAGELCQDLINQESPATANKRIFKNIDLMANATPATTALRESISRLAIACWQRRETASEAQALTELVSETVGANEAHAARKATLAVCTAILSSLQGYLN